MPSAFICLALAPAASVADGWTAAAIFDTVIMVQVPWSTQGESCLLYDPDGTGVSRVSPVRNRPDDGYHDLTVPITSRMWLTPTSARAPARRSTIFIEAVGS